jgi:hypothetical protein
MRLLKTVFIAAGFLLVISLAYAVDDGFGAAKKIESQHFEIFYSPQVDPYSLLEKLGIGPAETVIAGGPRIKGDNLGAALDTLYGIVMRALDMNLYSLQSTLKICRDRQHLDSVYESIFGRPSQAGSFYINEYNTIYISADDFTKSILGHEIAHMIISHYFVVQPPERVAEILSGYVEYQLRKSGGQ